MGYYGSIRNTWLRQQGRGMGHGPKASTQKWYCDGCKREHAPTTTRFVTIDKRNLCQRQFLKEPTL